MADLNTLSTMLPAGGGAFTLNHLTIGVFCNDQPTHHFGLGRDRVQSIPLRARQGWILPPGAAGICTYDAPLDVRMIEIAPRLLQEVGLADPEQFAPLVGDIDPLTLELALGAETFSKAGTLYRETMHRALASQLVNTLQSASASPPSFSDVRLRRVVDYIHDNLAEDLTLEIMSGIAAMSGYHFSRAFKAETGRSPLQYVISERIALAKVLLKTTRLTVSEICFRAGYKDLSRFGQHFKRATGTTPAKFRAH